MGDRVSGAIDVVLCTKGRDQTLDAAIASICADPNPDLRLVIVDQNTDDRVGTALARSESDSRVVHMRQSSIGLGDARNIGLSACTAPVVCFTDDDCVVPNGWADSLAAAIHAGELSLVYGDVIAKHPNSDDGFTPETDFVSDTVFHAGDPLPRYNALGLGANMAVDRLVAVGVHGFDPLLGAGGRFPSAEDRELALRLLLAGHRVGLAKTPPVIHDGLRSHGQQARDLVRRDFRGLGAMHAKLIKLRARGSGSYTLKVLAAIVADVGRSSLHARRPSGLRKVWAFVGGFGRGLSAPVDASTKLFDVGD